MDQPDDFWSTMMEGVLDRNEARKFQERLVHLAWRWYRIRPDVAEDVVQAALLAFLEVRDRYPNRTEHPKILVGVFRNKCRELVGKSVSEAKKMSRLRADLEAGESGIASAHSEATPEDGVLQSLLHREDGRLILKALSELRPCARDMFRLIIEEGYTRADLIERYGVNRNTLDSRLRAYRSELREILARRGILI